MDGAHGAGAAGMLAIVPEPLAYFLTWTTYGTWLHGDARGSIDLDHNRPGNPVLPGDAQRAARARARMHELPLTLSPRQRETVAHAVRDHAAHRGWAIHALNVRSNHVHVVIDCRTREGCPAPERVLRELKAWGTRRLKAAGLVRKRCWTDHGSTRWINNEPELIGAIDYVTRLQ
jgi:REP element-mobilizing transposase RayT